MLMSTTSNLVGSDLGCLINGAKSCCVRLNYCRFLDCACCNIGLCVRILLSVFWHFCITVPLVQCMVNLNFDSKLWSQLSKTNVTKALGCIILGTNVLDKTEACVSAALVLTRFTSPDEIVWPYLFIQVMTSFDPEAKWNVLLVYWYKKETIG